MPFLLSITRLVIAFFITVLTFVGIDPKIKNPDQKTQENGAEERKALIRETLGLDKNKKTVTETVVEDLLKDSKKNLPDLIVIKQNEEPVEQKTIETEPEENIKIENFSFFPTINKNKSTDAVVKITCTKKTDRGFKVNSGSGVFIDPRGIIITNAHVASSILSTDKNTKCSVEQKIIPTYGFTVSPIYFPEDWAEKNKGILNNTNPIGTGEDDYSLLAVTGNTNTALKNPSSFDFVLTNPKYIPKEGDQVLVAGYPGTLEKKTLTEISEFKSDYTTIDNVYTFGGNSIDLFSTKPNIVSAHGASGGGAFKDDSLVGLIVTTNNKGKGDYLNAIAIKYIDKDIKKDFGYGLKDLSDLNINSVISDFNENLRQELFNLVSGN